jgi:hypothetical protein
MVLGWMLGGGCARVSLKLCSLLERKLWENLRSFFIRKLPQVAHLKASENTFTALRLLAYAVNYAEEGGWGDGGGQERNKVKKFFLKKYILMQ